MKSFLVFILQCLVFASITFPLGYLYIMSTGGF